MAQAYSVVPARPLAPAAPADVPILDTPSKRLMQHVRIRVCLLSPSLVFLTFIHVGTVSPSCPHTLRKVPLCVRVCARVCILAYASICASTWAVETHVQSCPRPVSRPPGERMGLDGWTAGRPAAAWSGFEGPARRRGPHRVAPSGGGAAASAPGAPLGSPRGPRCPRAAADIDGAAAATAGGAGLSLGVPLSQDAQRGLDSLADEREETWGAPPAAHDSARRLWGSHAASWHGNGARGGGSSH